MKLLITGIPGSGKTTIGNFLHENHSFQHFDVEAAYETYGEKYEDILCDFVSGKSKEHKVITWGFMPGHHDGIIKNLQKQGFKMFWFDGNRNAARKAFISRGNVSEKLLEAQIERIDKMNFSSFNFTIINSFDDNGIFLEKNKIAQQLIASGH